MMLFKPRHVPMILGMEGSPKKTQTRRAWAKQRVNAGSLQWAQLKMFDKASRFARLHIKRVWRESLGSISPADARAEGGYTKKEFLGVFEHINGPTRLEQPVYVVEFEVVVQCPKCGTFSRPIEWWDETAFKEKEDPAQIMIECPGGRLYPSEEASVKEEGPFKILDIGYYCTQCFHHWGEKDWLTTIDADKYGPWWD